MNWLSCKRVDSQHDDWVLWVVGIMVGIFTFEEKYENCNKLNRKKTCYRPISMPGYGRECPELPGNAQGSPGEAGNFQLVIYNALPASTTNQSCAITVYCRKLG